MQCNLKRPARALLWSLAAMPPCSHAINGAQPGGRGVGNAAMGGASIALPLDAISPANNPAGLSAVPDSIVLDFQVFHGRSSADYVLPDNHLSNHQTALAPEGGGAWHASPGVTLGLALVTSGTGADYNDPPKFPAASFRCRRTAPGPRRDAACAWERCGTRRTTSRSA
jgi:long-chain fatty acid transport protein